MNLSPGATMALTVISSVLASGGLWALIQSLVLKHSQTKSAMAVAVQCLLRNEIMKAYEKYSKLGYCDPDDKTNLEHMFRAYTALGGNDVAHKAYLNLMDLPSYPPKHSN